MVLGFDEAMGRLRAMGAAPAGALRGLVPEIGRSHELAVRLWGAGLPQARILASMLDLPEKVSEEQMESWAGSFDSAEVCDQCCGNLFWQAPWAYKKAPQWACRPEEFVRRAGFMLMAELACRDADRSDAVFSEFLPLIVEGASDERPAVHRAANLALKRVGSRNVNLNRLAVEAAGRLVKSGSGAARWAGRDALFELTGAEVRRRLGGG